MKRNKRVRTKPGWRWLTALSLAISLVAGIIAVDSTRAQSVKNPLSGTPAKTNKYIRDLTTLAEQGRFNSVTDRVDEINRVIEVLSHARRNNPVVLSDSQVIRDVIAAGVARQIAEGSIPPQLARKRLLKLDLQSLFRDSKTSADLQKNLATVLSEISASGASVILFIDPIQTLVGASAAFDGAVSALLREAIKKGELQCLGASTDITFEQNIASDETLAPLFAPVEMKEVAEAKNEPQDDAANASNVASSGEEFTGQRISSDLNELLDSGNAPERVKAILQVDDANSADLHAKLTRFGVSIDGQMAQFRSLAIDLPTKAVAELAANSHTRYLSLDRAVKSFGHVQNWKLVVRRQRHRHRYSRFRNLEETSQRLWSRRL